MMGAFFRVALVAISAADAFHCTRRSIDTWSHARISKRADFRHRMRPDSSQEQSDTTLSTAQRTRLQELLDESEDGPLLDESEDGRLLDDSSTKQVDLGFLRQVSGVYTDAVGPAGPPPSVFALATKNFRAEFDELVRSATEGAPPPSGAVEEAIDALVLSNRNIARRERRRAQVAAPWVVKVPYVVLCAFLDAWFEDRPIARFWFLETVARMPYFAYISMLHLYETLGWWRRSAEAKRVHFAQEVNEFHHLLVMESLGGDRRWADRFFAQHAAIIYYWVLIALWLLSPTTAYTFSELIEAHAVDTYGEFVDANAAALAALEAPAIARAYYGSDVFKPLLDDMRTSERPRAYACDTLLDVFENIRDDEQEHVATAAACADPDVVLRAPGQATSAAGALAAGLAIARYFEAAEFLDADLDLVELLGLGALMAQLQALPFEAPFLTEAAAYLGDAADFLRQLFS
jgi:ubiquinol oxidase